MKARKRGGREGGREREEERRERRRERGSRLTVIVSDLYNSSRVLSQLNQKLIADLQRKKADGKILHVFKRQFVLENDKLRTNNGHIFKYVLGDWRKRDVLYTSNEIITIYR